MKNLKKETTQIGNRFCRVYAMDSPSFLLIQSMGQQEVMGMDHEVKLIEQGSRKAFVRAACEISDWERELTPWPDPAVSKAPTVGLCARETLSYVEQHLLPWLYQHYGNLPCIIGGYSLWALFALWASSESDSFEGVAASSPSIWIRDWLEYSQAHPTRAKHVYMSLGDKEEFVKDKAISQVGNNVREYHKALISQLGKSGTVLEWNRGGHYQNGDVRTARGFAWNLNVL